MEIKKNTIVIIAYGCYNSAVWNAFQMHIEFIRTMGYPVSFIVEKKYSEIVKKDYPKNKLYTYRNIFDLMIKLINLKEESIYSPAAGISISTFFAKVIKNKKVYYWVQGIIPEESFLKHQSKIRYFVLSVIEYLALTISSKQIFVSDEMKMHLEMKYKKKYSKSIIVPCISEFEDDNSVKEKDSFVYLGGMSAWQRVDRMLELFNDIVEYSKPNAKLYIATLEKQKAQIYIHDYLAPKYHKNVEVLSIVNRDDVSHFLSTKEFGFLIREESVVNYVSSPIKLAEYLSCGVNVIISESVKSYASTIEENGAGINLKENERFNISFNQYISNRENAHKVYDYFFSAKKHLESYAKLFGNKKG